MPEDLVRAALAKAGGNEIDSGKLDAKADRRTGRLLVHALHEDVPFSPAVRADVEAEIDALADWLKLSR